MALTRRGFLQTLAAAAFGAAVFDPKSLLWVPKSAEILTVDLAGQTPQAVIDRIVELDDLALRFAQALTDRLERHPSVVLREVMFRHGGRVDLLDVEALGLGTFEPVGRRMLGRESWTPDPVAAADDMVIYELRGVDMFAPITRELRPGEPFTDDVFIGTATDPESGLSVRVLQFEQDRARGRTQKFTGFEIAGGHWYVDDDSGTPYERFQRANRRRV